MSHVTAMGPVNESGRLSAMDATRGLALLGIFLVNIQLMARPLGEVLRGGLGGDGGVSTAAWYVEHIFAEGRSFPLFSMLFGMGMALQMERAAATQRRFWPVHVRRVLVLGFLGIAHALLLWFGDILFYYACVGAFVMLFARARVEALVAWGLGLWAATILIMGALLLLSLLAPAETSTELAAPVGATMKDLLDGLGKGAITDPEHPTWIAVETNAFREGPFGAAFAMRLLLWGSGMFFYFLLTGHILLIMGLFLIGMAIVRSSMLTDPTNPWPRRMAVVGLGVVLPISALLSWLSQHSETEVAQDLAVAAHSMIGPLQSMGYLGAMVLLYRVAARGAGSATKRVLGILATTGRMPLTNYLTQSLVGAAVFQHWGLAQFGQWKYASCAALVMGVFALQVLFSHWWMARFRFGPMEWLWRGLSYGAFPSMRRGNSAQAISA